MGREPHSQCQKCTPPEFWRDPNGNGSPFAIEHIAHARVGALPPATLSRNSMSFRFFQCLPVLGSLAITLSAAQSGCTQSAPPAERTAASPAATRGPLVIPAPAAMAPTTATPEEQRAFMLSSARAAWTYVSREVTPIGFVGATKNYQYLTVWDMASELAAAYSARELGFITPAAYQKFVDRTFTSIEKLTLYDNAAFNRMYSAQTGALVDSKGAPSTVGMGWSGLDHGRLFVWLKLVAADDLAFATRAQALVSKLNMSRLVRSGYMQGEEIVTATNEKRGYQEGRVGYEQYAAEGFALWGAPVDSAIDYAYNAKPVVVNGQTIVTDARGGDVMTSEPFVMMGLELGWKTDTWRNLSLAVLAAQEARWKQTGIVTMVSEDAIPVPPAYFYYYLLYHEGTPFVVTTVRGVANDSFPRWVSAKAAFGFHALAPTNYTWTALQAVKNGGNASGWTAGVYEGTKKSTDTYNLNTAAIVLESAAYMKRGCAFIQKTCVK